MDASMRTTTLLPTNDLLNFLMKTMKTAKLIWTKNNIGLKYVNMAFQMLSTSK